MLDIQLGRRNLSPIQRIAVAEKYRPIYEKQAKERQSKYYGNQYDNRSAIPSNLTEVQNNKDRNSTTEKTFRYCWCFRKDISYGCKSS